MELIFAYQKIAGFSSNHYEQSNQNLMSLQYLPYVGNIERYANY